MKFGMKTIILTALLVCASTALAARIEVPVPPGFDPPSGPVYSLQPRYSAEFNDPEYQGSAWQLGKTIHYTSRTVDAFFIVFTDGTVLHSFRRWQEADQGDMGLSEEMDWSAMVAAGTGGLVNGLVMDILTSVSGSLWVSDWNLRAPGTTAPTSGFPGPVYRLARQDRAASGASGQDRAWQENKKISYLRYDDSAKLLSLVFTDGSGITVGNQWSSGTWENGGEADWEALAAMGAMAMSTGCRVNLLVEGSTVVSWTLH